MSLHKYHFTVSFELELDTEDFGDCDPAMLPLVIHEALTEGEDSIIDYLVESDEETVTIGLVT